ncbi:MAG TPA: serine/threonine-protein kinase [Kofleriaceae bacterium]|jgi:serine/threonine-protein kinase|nr:serine/threonine-protein kinase [Kofleriaceae bacterium]
MPSAPAPKSPEIKVGDLILDRYRVVEQIGSGGHSVVFKGTDERLSRPVCIKVFSGLGGQSGVGRTSYEHFVQEAFALSRLTHPNTLRIYDFGHLGNKDAAGMPLQVCEYMSGGTLSQIIREQGRQSVEETVKIVSAMCAALAEAHQLGIVHRDIKPQNILFGSVAHNRLPKLADFGIAKWSADGDREQRAEDTAIVAGQKLAMYSPSWAAPEQLAGQAVSPATDIYSLAVVAVYMLSGKAIFADEDVYAGYKKRRHADDLVRDTLQPVGVPRGIVSVLAHALAFDPKKRILRVDELANELHAALEPVTEEVSRVTMPGKRLTGPPQPATPTVPHAAITPPTPTPVVQPGDGPPAVASAAAPTPPAVPVAADPTPATFHAPAAQAWMSAATASTPKGPVRRVPLADTPQPVADRRVHFVMVGNNVADLVGLHGTKVRVTLLPAPNGQRVVHVKGLTCFVALLGGRPSPAVQITQSSDLALVTPRAQEIGHLRVMQGRPDGAAHVFAIGSENIGVGIEDCADPILFDFGPGSDAYFVYTNGRIVPKSGRRG